MVERGLTSGVAPAAVSFLSHFSKAKAQMQSKAIQHPFWSELLLKQDSLVLQIEGQYFLTWKFSRNYRWQVLNLYKPKVITTEVHFKLTSLVHCIYGKKIWLSFAFDTSYSLFSQVLNRLLETVTLSKIM